jgi:hypothetical protein
MIDLIVFGGLCAVLLFVPLPIGSVEEWAVFVFEAATVMLLLVYLGGLIGARRRARGAATSPVGGGAGPGFNNVTTRLLRRRLPAFQARPRRVLAVSFIQLIPLPVGWSGSVPARARPHAGLVQDGSPPRHPG